MPQGSWNTFGQIKIDQQLIAAKFLLLYVSIDVYKQLVFNNFSIQLFLISAISINTFGFYDMPQSLSAWTLYPLYHSFSLYRCRPMTSAEIPTRTAFFFIARMVSIAVLNSPKKF